MIKARIPANEPARIRALRIYDVLDTPPERAFDDLTFIASQVCGTPIALVSLVDVNRQWFKSKVGLGLETTETPREVAFCSHAILQPEDLFVVSDSHKDQRFADNPLVTGDPKVRSYAGAPLVSPEGYALGTLCVIDRIPRELSVEQLDILRALARQVVTQLELRRNCFELNESARQLGSANEELSGRNEEIKRFYHTLAHELKTPLTAAKEYVSILADGLAGPVTTQQEEYLGIARDNCEQINLHINDLLDMTRLETGKLSVDRRRIPLSGVVDGAMASMNKRAEEKGLDLSWRAEPGISDVFADEARMRQVVSNLVSNAIKFTDTGGSISVKVRKDSDREGFVRVDVADTGIGIAPEHITKIFDRLYQVSWGDSCEKGGLGIGLSLCRELVHQHDGEITVLSEKGTGTTFSFTVPIYSESSGWAAESDRVEAIG